MRKILLSFSLVILIISLVSGATNSFYSDTETSNINSFSAGTLDLNPDPNTPGNFLPFTISGMRPGSGTHNEDAYYYRVNLRNDGTMNLKYKVRIVVDPTKKNAFYDALRVKLGEYSSGPSKSFGSNLTLSDLESGILIDSNVIPTALDTRVRTVYFRFFLPTTAPDNTQGLTTGFDIYFDATQTDNPSW